VKLDRALAARARYVAELRRMSLAEYLTEALRPVVKTDFARANRKPDARTPAGGTDRE
jgi:hypothetical protein